MMSETHRPFGSLYWLASVAAANQLGAGINPIVAGAGALIASSLAAGRPSPDIDVTLLKKLGHRKATHRPDTTAMVYIACTVALWIPASCFLPFGLHWLIWAPVNSWWSHLTGDAIFGRLPLGRRMGKLLSHILPNRLLRESKNGSGLWWIGLGLDTDGLLERGNRLTDERSKKTGLRKTKKILPFAPTTFMCRQLTKSMMILVVAQWVILHR